MSPEDHHEPAPAGPAELRIVLPGPAGAVIACQAVLFDLDGTLVDSAVCVEQVWTAWSARHGLDPAHVVPLSQGRQQQATIALVAPDLDAGAESGWLRRAEEDCRDGIAAVPGAAALLAALPPGQWAVVTSGWQRLAEIRLAVAGLPRPRVLVTSDEVAASKPAPDGYLRAAAELGVPPQACLVVEDAPVGVAAARAAGLRVLGVTTTFGPDELRADYLIPDFGGIAIR
jgi:sugar-phosphatase